MAALLAAAAPLWVTLSRILTTLVPASSVLLDRDGRGDAIALSAPPDVAKRLNREFPMDSQKDMYSTLTYSLLDTRTRLLWYVLAGQPAPILARVGQPPRKPGGGGLPIGLSGDADFEEHTLELEPGDLVCFYSDGITKATNGDETMLATKGLVRFLEQSGALPLYENVATCIDALSECAGPVPFPDDVSLLALEIPCGSPWPRAPQAFRWCRRWLRNRSPSECPSLPAVVPGGSRVSSSIAFPRPV